MPWIVLIASAVFEAVWATALGASEGLSRLLPSVIFFSALVVSMVGLGWAARHIPMGTAYAVWTGIGAALTVGFAVVTGTEALTVWKAVFLTGIIGAVVGLKLVPAGPRAPAESTTDAVPASSSGSRG